jgi:hypothetical protein
MKTEKCLGDLVLETPCSVAWSLAALQSNCRLRQPDALVLGRRLDYRVQC